MADTHSDRNLLTGILALQMDFIDREQLLAAMNAWMLRKATPLAALLEEQSALTADTRALLEALVEKHLSLHNGDPQQSLAALSSIGTVRDNLTQMGDPDIEASLRQVSAAWPGPDDVTPTLPAGGGTSTSGGRRFRILRPHAEGGLGRILVARDEELHREVALKEMLARHAHDTDSRARFLMEAEITGGLEHPGVVPVYGLGQYADGRPFYAMRFIRGDSLKEAIERFHRDDAQSAESSASPDAAGKPAGQKGNGVRQTFESVEFRKLLGRFIDVCNAIEYAHSRGVLHRDLKPGNIMLGKYGETLVVDWGLAKPLGRREGKPDMGEATLRPESGSGSHETEFGSAVGTPAYMSPEQAAGDLDAMGPASDVYSLGATLYCLLTGKSPFSGSSAGEVLRRVQQSEFRAPRAIRPDVPKPLEAVCLRAMARTPADRYPSPSALAEDLERWLADEPVTAHAEPVAVRARRWLRRHPKTVAALAATVLAGLSSMAGIAAVVGAKNQQLALANYNLTQANDAERQAKEDADLKRQEAEAAHQRADALYELADTQRRELDDYITQSDEYYTLVENLISQYGLANDLAANKADLLPRRRELTKKSLVINRRRAEKFAAEGDKQPELAALYLRMAEMASTVESVAESAEHYGRAAEVLEKLRAQEPENVDYQRDLARAYVNLGVSYQALGKTNESAAALERGHDLWSRLSGERQQYAASLIAKAYGLQTAGDPVGARAAYDQALEILQQLVSDSPEDDTLRSALAICQTAAASLYQLLGDLQAAEESYTQAEATFTQLAAEPEDAELRYSALGACSTALGAFYRQTNRPQAAEAAYNRAQATLQKLIDADPDSLKANIALANVYLGLGDLYKDDPARLSDAEANYLHAVERTNHIIEKHGKLPAYQSALALARTSLGTLYLNTGRPLQAVAEFDAAQQLRAALIDSQPEVLQHRRDLATSWENVGRALLDLNRPADAETAYRSSLETWQALVDEDGASLDNQLGLAAEHALLGWFYLSTNRLDASLDEYRRALELREKLAVDFPDQPIHHTNLAETCRYMGSLWQFRGDLQQAEASFQRNVQIHEQLAERYPQAVEFRVSLAQAHGALGAFFHATAQLPQALTAYGKALDIQGRLADDFPEQPLHRRELALLCYNLGQIYAGIRQFQQAEDMHQRALSIRQQLARDFAQVIEYQTDLIYSHHSLGQFYESVRQFEKADVAYTASLENLKRLSAEYPEVLKYRYTVVEAHLTLGRFYASLGQYVPAESNFRLAIATARRLAEDEPQVTEFRRLLGDTLNQQGGLLITAGKFADAGDALQSALAVQQKLAADAPQEPLYRDDLAITHMNFGWLHMSQEEFEAAKSQYGEAVGALEELSASYPNNDAYRVRLLSAFDALTRISAQTYDLPQARDLVSREVALAESLMTAQPGNHVYQKAAAICQRQLGYLHMMLDQPDEADAAYRKALDIQQPLAGAFPVEPSYADDLALTYVNVGSRLQYLDNPADAIEWFDRALTLLDSENFREVPFLAATRVMALKARAFALTELGRYDDAMADWERALELDLGANRDDLVIGRSGTLAYRGNYRRGLSEAEARMKETTPAPPSLHNMGCLYSIAVGAVRKDESLDEARRNELIEQYAAQAMQYLQQAKAGGIYRVPVIRNRLATHKDLAPIAERPEFQEFLKGLASEAESDSANANVGATEQRREPAGS